MSNECIQSLLQIRDCRSLQTRALVYIMMTSLLYFNSILHINEDIFINTRICLNVKHYGTW